MNGACLWGQVLLQNKHGHKVFRARGHICPPILPSAFLLVARTQVTPATQVARTQEAVGTIPTNDASVLATKYARHQGQRIKRWG